MEEITFGQRIKTLRLERGLTQRQLAAHAGIDFTYLSKIENDRMEHTPSIKTLQDLATALAVDELELMQAARKVPASLEPFVQNQDALRFFRRATQEIRSAQGWKDLLAYLDDRRDEES